LKQKLYIHEVLAKTHKLKRSQKISPQIDTIVLDGIWPCRGPQVPLHGNAGTVRIYRNLMWPRDCHVRFFNKKIIKNKNQLLFAFHELKKKLKKKFLTSRTARETCLK